MKPKSVNLLVGLLILVAGTGTLVPRVATLITIAGILVCATLLGLCTLASLALSISGGSTTVSVTAAVAVGHEE